MAGRGRDWQYRRKRKRTRAAAVLPPLILLLLLPSDGAEVFLTRIGPIWPDLGQNRPYQPIWLGYRIGISEQQYPIRIRTGRYATLRPFFKTLLVYNANDGTRSLLITVVFFFSVFLIFFGPRHQLIDMQDIKSFCAYHYCALLFLWKLSCPWKKVSYIGYGIRVNKWKDTCNENNQV